MPFEKIMERSGGPKEATDVWVIRFWNFKTVYYILIYGPYILCFNIICQPKHLEYFTVQLATGNGPILVHFLEVGQQQEDGQPGGGANLEPVV